MEPQYGTHITALAAYYGTGYTFYTGAQQERRLSIFFGHFTRIYSLDTLRQSLLLMFQPNNFLESIADRHLVGQSQAISVFDYTVLHLSYQADDFHSTKSHYTGRA